MDKAPGIESKTIRALRRVFSERHPAIIHTHQIAALLYAGLAAFPPHGVHILHTEHGKHYENRARTRFLGRCAGLFAERFLCVSHDIAESVVANRIVSRDKVGVVPNGIDTTLLTRRDEGALAALRHSLGIPPLAPVVGTIGRLTDVKRQDLLLSAFANVRQRVPDSHLVIVGDGPRMQKLVSLARELGLESACHMVGYQNEPERYLQLMDVFALTSASEGMPLVILEAWAAGVPVVASRVGGIPELIDDGRSGLLFNSGDQDALAASICRVIAGTDLAMRLSSEGKQVVHRGYTSSCMALEYERHYLELMEHGAKR